MGARFVEQEQQSKIDQFICLSPPSEQIWNPDEVSKNWPNLSKDKSFCEQLKSHQESLLVINKVLDKIPIDITIEESIDTKIVSESEVAEFYKSLNLLLTNEDYKRLVLYLPFEVIPSLEWKTDNQDLDRSVKEFLDTYLSGWINLLSVQDVRANFVDGDVIESDVRKLDPPRVVKAAHMIPVLIKKGLIKKEQILDLFGDVSDPVLKRSINDVLPVMRNLNQISITEYNQYFKPNNKDNRLQTETVTEERKRWLSKKQKEMKILDQAKTISEQIITGTPLKSPVDDEVMVEGIRMAIENACDTDIKQASQILEKYQETLLVMGNRESANLSEKLKKAWRHFYRLGLTDKNQLEQLQINLPNLSGNFFENLSGLSAEIEKLKGILGEIKSDADLDEKIFPVILIGGSKIKGYGELDSDTDVGVFIKPNITEPDKIEVREKLFKIFLKHNFEYRPKEFWLIEKGNWLKINDAIKKDGLMADNDWVHMLFDWCWLGEKKEINALRAKLLTPFFEKTDEIKYQHPIREMYFESMERDLIQYRLMHKGYERHYPVNKNSYKGNITVDGDSTFWDSGYRMMATKLFINNIFLPNLGESK